MIINQQITKEQLMKTLIFLFAALFIAFEIGCNAQPNTQTTFEIGIVNTQPGKTYKVFLELKDDSTSSQLQGGMDYLSPDVSSLIATLQNVHISGDTLLGEKTYPDLDHKRYLKAGLVQVDDVSLKYSAMKVTDWTETDMIEPNTAGFFIRKK